MYVDSEQMVLLILAPDPNQNICLDVMYVNSELEVGTSVKMLSVALTACTLTFPRRARNQNV